jgi:nitrate reductase beta subunit
MKVRAQIGMVLNLDKCIGIEDALPPPALASRKREGGSLISNGLVAGVRQ